jgi:hypothetical protein
MRLIYWSHSYRPEDAPVNRFFAELFDLEHLELSFDPPSDTVNAAKLQRSLNSSDAMVAVLTQRQSGPSPYILFEVELCIRSRKPLLVFVEDVLPDGLIPERILQRRFSRGSHFRQTREHRHALALLKTYVSDESPPRYQPAITQRSCVVAGDEVLADGTRDALFDLLRDRGFRVVASSHLDESEITTIEAITQSQAAIAFVDATQPIAHFSRGLLNGASVPMVEFTLDPAFRYRATVPPELQPLPIPAVDDWAALGPVVDSHLALFEEEFVEGATGEELVKYIDVLPTVGQDEDPGRRRYEHSERERVLNFVGRDVYIIGQAGAVGPGSRAERVTLVQTWNELERRVDTTALAGELARLRDDLRKRATGPEHDAAIGAIAEAELAAEQGDGPQAIEKLSLFKRLQGAGRWALDAATTIGTTVAAEAIKLAAGLG